MSAEMPDPNNANNEAALFSQLDGLDDQEVQKEHEQAQKVLRDIRIITLLRRRAIQHDTNRYEADELREQSEELEQRALLRLWDTMSRELQAAIAMLGLSADEDTTLSVAVASPNYVTFDMHRTDVSGDKINESQTYVLEAQQESGKKIPARRHKSYRVGENAPTTVPSEYLTVPYIEALGKIVQAIKAAYGIEYRGIGMDLQQIEDEIEGQDE